MAFEGKPAHREEKKPGEKMTDGLAEELEGTLSKTSHKSFA